MLHADLVVSADNRPLEQTPNALNSVRVNVSANPFLRAVINALMPRIRVANSKVSGKFVGVDRFGIWRGVLLHEGMKSGAVGVWENLKANLATTLNRTNGNRLVATVATAHAADFPANVSFIHFHDAAQQRTVGVPHGRTDAVAEIPCGLVGDGDCPLHLQRAHALLALSHQIDGEKPLGQRKVRVVKDGATRSGELIAAGVAIVLATIRDAGHALASAARALNASRPAKLGKTLAALVVIAELLNQFNEIHFRLNSGLCLTR